MKIDFKNPIILKDGKIETIKNMPDNVCYSHHGDGRYPIYNINGFTLCKYSARDFRTNRIGGINSKKHISLKKAIEYVKFNLDMNIVF